MKNRKGFTIVELVIVIAVIAILAAVLIPTFSGVISKANQSAAQQTAMQAVKSGLLMINTATLPADSLVVVDSDKNAASKPDYGYVYDGNALGAAIALYDNNSNTIKSGLTTGLNTILVSDKAFVYDADGNSFSAHELLDAVVTAFGKTGTLTAIKDATTNEVTGYKIVVTAATDTTPEEALTIFTSVDMPTNAFVFVKMG